MKRQRLFWHIGLGLNQILQQHELLIIEQVAIFIQQLAVDDDFILMCQVQVLRQMADDEWYRLLMVEFVHMLIHERFGQLALRVVA